MIIKDPYLITAFITAHLVAKQTINNLEKTDKRAMNLLISQIRELNFFYKTDKGNNTSLLILGFLRAEYSRLPRR